MTSQPLTAELQDFQGVRLAGRTFRATDALADVIRWAERTARIYGADVLVIGELRLSIRTDGRVGACLEPPPIL